MYGVARVVVTARQRDRLSSQQAARWPAKRHVKQPGLQVVETPMMAGATASGERSARLARANPVVASMAGASVTVPRQEPAAPSSGALLRRSATARAAKRRQLHEPNLGNEGRPTPRWQPLHASYAAGAADARSRAPRTLFLAAAAARCIIEELRAQVHN